MVALFFQTVFKAIGKLDFFVLLLKVYNLLSFLITNFVKDSVINSSIFEILEYLHLNSMPLKPFLWHYKIRFFFQRENSRRVENTAPNCK